MNTPLEKLRAWLDEGKMVTLPMLDAMLFCDPEKSQHDRYIINDARNRIVKQAEIIEMLFEALESIAAIETDFEKMLPHVERGKLISIIDNDTAIARDTITRAAELIGEKK